MPFSALARNTLNAGSSSSSSSRRGYDGSTPALQVGLWVQSHMSRPEAVCVDVRRDKIFIEFTNHTQAPRIGCGERRVLKLEFAHS